jgi:hypothetical protein
MLRNSARSLGIFRAQWLADYYRLRQPALPGCWRLAGRGLVVPVNVETLGEMWLHRDRWRSGAAPGGKLPPATARCFRLSTRWSGIGNALSSCSISAIGWSAIPRAKVSMATLFYRCCIGENWSGGWMQNASQNRELEIFALWLEEGER